MVIVEGGDPWEWGRDVLFPHLTFSTCKYIWGIAYGWFKSYVS